MDSVPGRKGQSTTNDSAVFFIDPIEGCERHSTIKAKVTQSSSSLKIAPPERTFIFVYKYKVNFMNRKLTDYAVKTIHENEPSDNTDNFVIYITDI